MKKLLLLALCMCCFALSDATYKPGYYDKMEGKRREALKQAAKECVKQHTMLNYTNLPNNWIYTDVYPDLYNGQKRWWEMYSNEIYLIRNGQSGLQSFRDCHMQREHSVPKSWWGSDDSSPAWTDIYNLYPSDGPANQAKLNYPLGPVDPNNAKFNNGATKVGVPAPGFAGGSGMVFEPADEYKGDFARAYFYVFTVYDNLNWTANSMGNRNEWPTLKPWAYEMLLQWSRQDPVSQKEIQRNDAAERQQGNRNPFVDFPELAEYIWGTKSTEIFYIKDQNGGTTPPITGDPELTAPINGEALDFGETAVNGVNQTALIVNGTNMTSALTMRVTGTDRSMFSLSSNSVPAASVNAQGGTKVDVFYRPTATGTHTANITIYDGGLKAEQQVNVVLKGQALPKPNLTAVTANAPTSLTDSSYVANWTAAAEVVDYYIVTRTQYLPSGTVTTTEEAPSNSLQITGRRSDCDETYSVQSSRLGFTSPASNTMLVKASGVEGIEAEPLMIGWTNRGFMVLADRLLNLRALTPDGRTVYFATEAQRGTEVELPAGIYIITAQGGFSPVKIVVAQ